MPEKCDLLAALTSNRQPFQVVALSIRHPQVHHGGIPIPIHGVLPSPTTNLLSELVQVLHKG
jgi:hypothetical protein